MSTKPFLTVDQQLSLLERRGLIVRNRSEALHVLSSINYYRLSAYSLTLRSDNIFIPGTTFETIVSLYNFDAKLRCFIMKYSAKIEISLRTHMAYIHSQNHGPLGYMNSTYFKDKWYHAAFLTRIQKLLNESKEAFVIHHKNDLGGVFPFWVVVEVMTFDVASKCLQNMNLQDQTEIALCYDIHPKFLQNWTHCSVIARNIAAHGGRFYNRPIATKAIIPNAVRGRFSPERVFSYLYAMYHLLESENDRELFIFDFEHLLSSSSSIDYSHLGIPQDWKAVLNVDVRPDHH